MKRLVLGLIVLFEFCGLAYSAESDLQLWTSLVVQGPVQSRLQGYFEYQPRFGNDLKRLDRVITRPALVYKFSDQISVALGYGWIPVYNPTYSSEQRIWQQFVFQDTVVGIKGIGRSRFEQRFFQNNPKTSLRFRQMLRAQAPICSLEDTLWVVYDEIFFNFNSVSSSSKSGYDQNRLFVGVNQKLHSQIRMDFGYIFNHVHRSNADDRINHVIATTLALGF